MKHFDIIIIGGGHAGLEAAFCSAQFEALKVAIITMPGIGIASSPCNPSIGGIGKGQIVREIDSMGGVMGRLADSAGIQYRILNESKGFAVHSTRVQIDKDIYSQNAEDIVSKIKNLSKIYAKIVKLQRTKDKLFQLISETGDSFFAKKIILTIGTFGGGLTHIGKETQSAGRRDCSSSNSIKDIIEELGVPVKTKRFKTGTPARILKRSIDFSVVEEQESDDSVRNFHLGNLPNLRVLAQESCYLTETNSSTWNIIKKNKEKSPMYNGQISSTGARYCPSIEDKVFRYPDKTNHHIFLEPEGLASETVYPSGISTSLPKEIQLEFIRSIKGLENAEIAHYGYAVEYDVVDTSMLDYSLQFKAVEGLYIAGQVCGTSGYEEAAAQGLVAGFNAALSIISPEKTLKFARVDSYIGVMIEDLISNERDEPYRLFTARSESRLVTREDNAPIRMSSYREMLGLSLPHDKIINNYVKNFKKLFSIVNSQNDLVVALKQGNINPIEVLRAELIKNKINTENDLIKAVAIEIKYGGYVEKSNQEFIKIGKLYNKIINLEKILKSENVSFECKKRIEAISPKTFGQLRLINGIRASSIAAIAGDL